MRNLMAAVFLAVALIVPTGCKRVTATTPGAPTAQANFYQQAAKTMADFSGIEVSAQQLFTNAHATGLVNDSEYLAGQKAFAVVATQGEAITSLLQSGASQTTIIAQIDALSTQIGQMPSAFGIKNPQSQAAFTALMQTLQNMLSSVTILVQSHPATTPATP